MKNKIKYISMKKRNCRIFCEKRIFYFLLHYARHFRTSRNPLCLMFVSKLVRILIEKKDYINNTGKL